MQTDYKLLLKSIKSVEKQLVSEKVEKARAVVGKKGATTGLHNPNVPGAVKPHSSVPAPDAPAKSSPYQYPPSGGYKDNNAYTY
ncbi:MAG: hypothetical protein IE914_11060 [Thiotrichales bacterium]|nr:hypothetical protein [Thiotrichales bacterium]